MNEKIRKLIFLSMMFTVIFWGIDYCNIPSRIGLDIGRFNFGFWSMYTTIIGGVLAGVLTLYGVIETIRAQHLEQKEEAKRLVMPMLKIENGKYDYRWKYIQFDFDLTKESKMRERKDIADTAVVTIEIKNVGSRELCELFVGDIDSTFFNEGGKYYSLCPIIYSGDSMMLNLCLYEKGSYDNDNDPQKFHILGSPMSFSCYYKDCLGNWYKQDFLITFMHSIMPETPIDQRALNISIERIQIGSAPTEVSEKALPWIQNTNKLVYC